ncbi:type I restriction endonuclease [Paludicola sp. MB14-C6]|uniref:type I restriction endonuclease n=1 Tax=Paludihabitans sp. MB14-C6 TaxID=3070656 RepID=UPI0027DE3DF4|nr:type I restriction endonuclease [Paludicola sp. MB14-C6]WMJ23487.1 type I restriction endonuclease [Paludicola sp. MB14-C6]
MDFIDQVKQFSKRVENLKDNIQTEEATKTSIIMPFFALLGYDVFNPDEFVPEFIADVGIKKGEKVDYAILNDGLPVILIEAKWIGENLQKHDSQLFRYFGTTAAKFAILTNGQYFRFYTDLQEKNKMDEKPFLEINILDIKENQVAELKKFHKSNFDVNEILDTASELKYSYEFKNLLAEQLQQPSDDFLRFFLTSAYDGLKTQAVLDRFRPILKKSLNNYISELMNDKIKSALGVEGNQPTNDVQLPSEEPELVVPEKTSKIFTTNDELEAYFIVKNILKDYASVNDIGYKDTESYLSILFKSKVTNWICRLILTENKKVLIIPDQNKKEIKNTIDNIYDIYNYKDQLVEVLSRYQS